MSARSINSPKKASKPKVDLLPQHRQTLTTDKIKISIADIQEDTVNMIEGHENFYFIKM